MCYISTGLDSIGVARVSHRHWCPIEELDTLIEMLSGTSTKTDSGLDVTVLEQIDVMNEVADCLGTVRLEVIRLKYELNLVKAELAKYRLEALCQKEGS